MTKYEKTQQAKNRAIDALGLAYDCCGGDHIAGITAATDAVVAVSEYSASALQNGAPKTERVIARALAEAAAALLDRVLVDARRNVSMRLRDDARGERHD